MGADKCRYNPGISLNLKKRGKRSFKLIVARKHAQELEMERLKGAEKCLQQNKM